MIKLKAAVDIAASKRQINQDIKNLEKTVNMLKLSATLLKGESKQQINAVIAELSSKVKTISLKADLDSKQAQKAVNDALKKVSISDINISEQGLKLKVRKIFTDLKSEVSKVAIPVNLELKKETMQNQLTSYLTQNSKIGESSVLLNEADTLRNLFNNIDSKDNLKYATDKFKLFKSEVVATGFASKSTTDKIGGMIGNITRIGSLFGAASFGIQNYVKAVSTLKSMSTILTEITKTSNIAGEALKKLGNDSFGTASKYGQTATNYLEGVREMARSGYDSMAKELGELSVLAQSAGDMTAEMANNYLLATDAAYKYGGSVEKLNAALDGANYISNRNSATLTDIADATRVSASYAAQAGVKVDELTAAESTMIAVTKRSGSEMGRAFRSILLNLQQVSGEFDGEIIDEDQLKKVEKRVHGLGVELETMGKNGAELRNPMEVLKELSQVYNSLPQNSVDRQGLISDLGGKFHANALTALLSRWDMYEKMLSEFSQGSGSSLTEAMKTADSWEGRLNSLQNTWDSFVSSITNQDAIKGGISFLDGTIQSFQNLIDTIGAIPVLLTTVNTALTALNKNYGITQLFNTDTGKIDVQGNIMGIDFTAIKAQKKHFEEASTAIEGWNNKLKLGQSDINDFGLDVVKNNAQLKDYLSTCSKDAPASLQGYQSYLKAAGVSTDALRWKTVALNAVVSLGVGAAIQLAVSGISALIQRQEKAKQAATEAADRIESLSNTLKSNQQTVSDSAKRFAELAQGIDALTGKNVSLTDGDYQEFLSISNDLAKVFPTLSRNYDENGNAIVNLSGNVDTIVGSLRDLIEAQRDLTNSQIADELPTVFKGASAKSDAYKAELDNLEQQRDALVKSLGNVQSNDFADTFIDGISKRWLTVSSDNLEVLSQMKSDYEKLLKEANIDFETLTPNYKTNEKGQEIPVDFTFNITSSDKDIKNAKNMIDKGVQELAIRYEKDITELNTDIANTNSKNKSNWSSLGGSIAAWLNSDSSYKVMSDSMQSSIQQIINNLDWSTLDFSSWDDAKEYVQDNIIGLFEGVDGSKIAKQFSKAFDLKTQFQNGEISLDEYLKGVSDFKALIDGFDDNTKKSIDFIFTVSSPDGSSVDAMMQGVEDKLQDSAIEKVGELSLGDLEIAFDKIDVPQGTLLSWEELIDLINKYKESIKTAPDFASTFSNLPIDKVEEYVSMLNSGTITEKNISSFSELNDIMSKTGISAEDAVKAIKDYSDGFTLSTDLTSNLQNAYDLLQDVEKQYNKTKIIGLSSLEAIVEKYPQLRSAVNEYTQDLLSSGDILAQLKTAYDNDANAYKSAMAYKMSGNEDFFGKIKDNNQGLFDSLSTAYGVDVKNWKTMAQAKAEIDQTLIRNLSTAWSKYYNIVIDSVSGLASFAGQDIGQGSSHGSTMPVEQQKAWSAATEQVGKYNQIINKLNEAANITVETPDFNGIGSAGSGSKEKTKKDFSEVFDWVSVTIDRVNEKVEKLQNQISDATNWKVKNILTDTAIDEMSNKLSALQSQADAYQKQANLYDVSPIYLDKIKNGTLEIETVTDETISNNIKSYQEWYNKAEDVRKQIDETKKSMKELAQSRLDNIINDFDSLTSLMKKYSLYSENLINLQTDLGEEITNTDFEQLINQQRGIYDELQGKYETLSTELSKAVSKGTIQVGTEEWRKYNGELLDVKSSMNDVVSSMNDFRKSMIDLPFNELKQFTNSINLTNSGISAMVELLGDEGLTDKGMITSKGLAKIALLGQEYTNAKQQVANYADAIDAVNEMYSNGSITQDEYNDKINEYTSAQLSAVQATKQAKDAIIQFRKNAIQEQITNMNDLISAKKDALKAEKDYQDYLDSVNKKQTNISNLQAKIDELSLRSDSSDRSAYAMKLQLEKQLKDAKDELAKEQADNAYNQQLDGLDKQAKNYEDAKNNELKELETSTEAQRKVVQDYLGQVKDNYKTVYSTLTQYGKDYGVTMTKELTSPWDSASSAVDTFQNAVSEAISQINIDIASIDLSSLTELVSTVQGLSGGGSSGGFEDITGSGTWRKAKDGQRWWYGSSDDDYASDGVYTIGGKQYGFDDSGYMLTGWSDATGEWRYFEPENGQMVKSTWRDYKGKQYYLKSDGTMATDMAIKDKSGSNKYYYVNDYGAYTGEELTYDEVKARNITVGYKNGTLRTKDEVALMDEDGVGSELMNKQGTLMQFKNGDAVFDSAKTKALWEMADDYNNPSSYITDKLMRNQANLSSSMIVNRASQPISLAINTPLINVEGSADEKTLIRCSKMITDSLKNDLPKYITQSSKKSYLK